MVCRDQKIINFGLVEFTRFWGNGARQSVNRWFRRTRSPIQATFF